MQENYFITVMIRCFDLSCYFLFSYIEPLYVNDTVSIRTETNNYSTNIPKLQCWSNLRSFSINLEVCTLSYAPAKANFC